jgi:hypothetical protein
MTFELLFASHSWKPIKNCPGRLVLSRPAPNVAPQDLAGPDIEVREYRVPAARDAVIVAQLADGGLISYRREDGSFVHTLNTPEGFERKLRQLGIGERPSTTPG